MVGNRKTVLPWHAYGDGSEKLTCLPKHFVKKTISAVKHTYQLRGVASTLHMRTTISPGQWPYCGVTRVSFSARIILYKYKISYERSTYPYPKSNIFLPHSYLLSSKRSTYCLQDKLLITKNCCYICTPHRTYFRPAKKFYRTSFTRD